MNLRQLEYFARVAETGGFAAASRALNVAQSAISRQIIELETELKTTLFLRGGRTTELTSIGKLLLDDVKDVLLRVDHLKIVARQNNRIATLMIGSSHSFGNFLFPRLSVALAAKNCGIAVGFSQGPTAKLLEMTQNGALDIAIISGLGSEDPPQTARIAFDMLCKEQLCLVGRKDLLSGEEPISPEDAFSRSLVMLPAATMERKSYEALANSLKVQLNVVADAENLTLMVALARSGLGLTLIPMSGFSEPSVVSDLICRPIRGVFIRRWIAYRRSAGNENPTRTVSALIRQIVTEVGPKFGVTSELVQG